jgi:hypothetical protein
VLAAIVAGVVVVGIARNLNIKIPRPPLLLKTTAAGGAGYELELLLESELLELLLSLLELLLELDDDDASLVLLLLELLDSVDDDELLIDVPDELLESVLVELKLLLLLDSVDVLDEESVLVLLKLLEDDELLELVSSTAMIRSSPDRKAK